jgi:hypothetical protein
MKTEEIEKRLKEIEKEETLPHNIHGIDLSQGYEHDYEIARLKLDLCLDFIRHLKTKVIMALDGKCLAADKDNTEDKLNQILEALDE